MNERFTFKLISHLFDFSRMISTPMHKILFAVLVSFTCPLAAMSQNIAFALSLNQKEDIRYGKAKKVEMLTKGYFGNAKPVSVLEYTLHLNKNNQVLVDESSGSEKGVYVRTYTLDSLTGVKLMKTTKEDGYFGKHTSIDVYQYDRNGFHTGIISYTPDLSGRKTSQTVIVVNQKGDPVEVIFHDASGKIVTDSEKAEYLYDRNEYILTHRSWDGKRMETDTLVLDPLQDYKFKNTNKKFNQQGDLIEKKISVTESYLYEYKYDSKGNWLEKKEYLVTIEPNGKKKKELQRFYSRKIEYWPE